MEGSLLDMVITTLGIVITMVLLSCLCCLCMKISDLRLKCHIVELAKSKGLHVDVEKLDRKNPSPISTDNETCTIMVPEVGIIL